MSRELCRAFPADRFMGEEDAGDLRDDAELRARCSQRERGPPVLFTLPAVEDAVKPIAMTRSVVARS